MLPGGAPWRDSGEAFRCTRSPQSHDRTWPVAEMGANAMDGERNPGKSSRAAFHLDLWGIIA
jgi:hypothetical protein